MVRVKQGYLVIAVDRSRCEAVYWQSNHSSARRALLERNASLVQKNQLLQLIDGEFGQRRMIVSIESIGLHGIMREPEFSW